MAIAPINVNAKAPPPNGCAKSYSRGTFHTAARKAFKRFPYTAHEQRTLKRVIRCQAFPKSVEIVRHHGRRYRSGFNRRFYWDAQWAKVPAGLKARLARLRFCESTNNYGQRGHHRGAYQYDFATWAEAGGSGDPADASPREQDVRTAWFFPSHTARWACKA